MPSLPFLIMSYATESPEGTLLCPSALLHLGSRAAVDQALSRLARKDELLRVCQGVYVRPIQTRFGPRPPAVGKVLASLSALWGEDRLFPGAGRRRMPLDSLRKCLYSQSTLPPAPTVSSSSVGWRWNCAMPHGGSWWPHTDLLAMLSVPWPGLVLRRWRRIWRRLSISSHLRT